MKLCVVRRECGPARVWTGLVTLRLNMDFLDVVYDKLSAGTVNDELENEKTTKKKDKGQLKKDKGPKRKKEEEQIKKEKNEKHENKSRKRNIYFFKKKEKKKERTRCESANFLEPRTSKQSV